MIKYYLQALISFMFTTVQVFNKINHHVFASLLQDGCVFGNFSSYSVKDKSFVMAKLTAKALD